LRQKPRWRGQVAWLGYEVPSQSRADKGNIHDDDLPGVGCERITIGTIFGDA
jgi:hypothetical protein